MRHRRINYEKEPPLPDARPRSDRFRSGGRESNFLAAITVRSMKGTPEEFTTFGMGLRMIDGYDAQ